MSKIEIESENGKFWCDFIDWINAYPDGKGTTIRVVEDKGTDILDAYHGKP